MRIAIVGGGINGLCCAWTLAQKNHEVELFERGELMSETSQASSKLLHGGLRYLETAQFRLVREALRERDAWFARAPHLASPLSLIIPIYAGNRRKRWQFGLGLRLYRLLAGGSQHRDYRWLDRETLLWQDPELNSEGLVGGYRFTDGQMDDHALGLWVAERARESGAVLHEHAPVRELDPRGQMTLEQGQSTSYDRIINVAGPWAERLATRSGQKLPSRLDPVRGSHLVVSRPCRQAYLMENPADGRIVFILPWKDNTLIGPTEVRQSLDDPIACSAEEESYLLSAHNAVKGPALTPRVVLQRFGGVRPLLQSAKNPNRASREYTLHRQDRLLTVLGGKWTTAPALASHVERALN
jgi:glycerol-3-phosphate dehydrogenase